MFFFSNYEENRVAWKIFLYTSVKKKKKGFNVFVTLFGKILCNIAKDGLYKTGRIN